MNDKNSSDAGAIIDTMKDLVRQPTTLRLDRGMEDEAKVLVVPAGMELRSMKSFLDEYREFPERRTGTATLTDLPSFIAHANRFKDEESAIFANRSEQQPTLTAIYDYHQSEDGIGPGARWCKHRGHYAMPLEKAWVSWRDIDGKQLDQKELAKFLEEHAMHMVSAPDVASLPEASLVRIAGEDGARRYAAPIDVRQTARGLRLNVSNEITSTVNLDTGEASLGFATTVKKAGDEAGQLTVPSLFLLNIPVFEGGASYPLPVRLRFEEVDKKLKWTLSRFRADLVFMLAFDEAAQKAAAETALPLFAGKPEA